MRHKRDLYIDYSNSLYGNRSRRAKNRNKISKVLLSILILILIGMASYGTLYYKHNVIDNDKPDRVDILKNTGSTNKIDNTKKVSNDTNNYFALKGIIPFPNITTARNNESIEQEKINVTENNEPEAIEANGNNKVENRKRVKVRGIYVSGPRAGSESYMADLIDLVDTTELNAMVIDVKNDEGEITYNMELEAAKQIGATVNYISNIKQLVYDLKKKDIYLIARIVAFKDPKLALGREELSLRKMDGTIFHDKAGNSWVNPYKREVWNYLISVAKEAVKLGFDEIQFDYIRFSTDSEMKNVNFGEEAKAKTKKDIITEFTKYACDELQPLGVFVSADVYGAIIDSKVDAEIVGQDYAMMANYLDYICPMIYPSHYADGSYGLEHPDLEPYNLIRKALEKSREVLSTTDTNSIEVNNSEINNNSTSNSENEINSNTNKAIVRSWLQDFTATWLTNHKVYGPDEIRDQIRAVYDSGYEEWILWNGNNTYTQAGLIQSD